MAGVESLVESREGLEADQFGDGDDGVVGRGEQCFGFVETAGADVLGEADTQLAVKVPAQVGFVGRELAGKHPDGEVGVMQEVGGDEEERGVFGGLHRDDGSIADHCSNQAAVVGQGSFCLYTGGIVGFNLGSQVYDCCKNSGSVNQKAPTEENNYLRAGGNTNVITACPNGHENTEL